MNLHSITVLQVKEVTHNVRSFRVEKPAGFMFTPGQATDLSLLKPGWENDKHPFTFTSLPQEDTLEFTIKIYHDRNGITRQLGMVKPSDRFEISDAWGAISYKGEGVFIAGGAGITPFIAILRDLHQRSLVGTNRLIFSNRTEKDIILHDELKELLGGSLLNVITGQPDTTYHAGRIDKVFLQQQISNFQQHFYVCGPDEFTTSILETLGELGAKPEALVFET